MKQIVYGAENIPINDLYVDEDSEPRRQRVASVFVDKLLVAWVPCDGYVWLEDALDFVDDKMRFKYFKINEIMSYQPGSEVDTHLLNQIVERFYNEELLQADFANCRWDIEDEQTGYREGYKTIE